MWSLGGESSVKAQTCIVDHPRKNAFHVQNSRKLHALRKSKPVLDFAIPLDARL